MDDWAAERDRRTTREAKHCLFAGSMVLGGLVFVFAHEHVASTEGSSGAALLLGLVAAWLHPFVGAVLARICEVLERFGFPDDHEPWTTGDRTMTAAFWPLSLPYFLITASVYGSINRLFR